MLYYLKNYYKHSKHFKGNAQFIFLCKSQKSLVNVCLMNILKSSHKKKWLYVFENLGEKNL